MHANFRSVGWGICGKSYNPLQGREEEDARIAEAGGRAARKHVDFAICKQIKLIQTYNLSQWLIVWVRPVVLKRLVLWSP